MASIESYTLPNGFVVNFPRPVETEEEARIIATRAGVKNGWIEPEEATESDVLPGIYRGFDQTVGSLSGGAASVLGYLGFEEGEQYFDSVAESYQNEASKHNRRIEDLDSALESTGNFIDYAQQVISENIPNMAGIAASSLAGAKAGAALGTIVPGWGNVAGGVLGAALGAFVPSAVMGAGQVREEIKELNPDIEGTEGAELLGGVAVGALDAAAVGVIFKPILAPFVRQYGTQKVAQELVENGIAKNVALGIARGVAAEAPTEAAQEAVQAGVAADAAEVELDLKALGPRLLEAAVAGGLTGGFFGGAAGLAPQKKQGEPENQQEETQEEEDDSLPPMLDLPAPVYKKEAQAFLEEKGINVKDNPELVQRVQNIKIAEDIQKEFPTLFTDKEGAVTDQNPLERWWALKIQKQKLADIEQRENEGTSQKERDQATSLREEVEKEQERIEFFVDKIVSDHESTIGNINRMRGYGPTPLDGFVEKTEETEVFTAEDAAVEAGISTDEARAFLAASPAIKEVETGQYQKQEIRYQASLAPKVDKAKTEVDGSNFFSDRALNRALSAPITSDETVVFLSPLDFLNLSDSNLTDADKDSFVGQLVEEGQAFDSLPELEIDTDGVVKVANGKSRARQTFKAGAQQIPVIVRGPFTWGQTAVRPDALYSQRDNSYSVPFPPIETFPTESERAFNRISGKDQEPDWTPLKVGLMGSRPSAKLVNQLDHLITHIPDKLKKMLGPGFILDLQGRIRSPEGNLVRGAQVGNTLYIALEQNRNIEETAYHEGWHYLKQNSDAFTEADRKLLENEAENLKQFVADHTGLYYKDLENLSDKPENYQEEMEAWAFGAYMANPRAKVPAKSVFEKAKELLRRTKNWLNGAGFRIYSDLFNDVRDGDRAAVERNQELVDAVQDVRYQNFVKDHMQKKHEEVHAERAAPKINKTDSKVIKDQNFGAIGKFLKFLQSIPGVAVRDALLAKFVNTYQAKEEDKNVLITAFKQELEDLTRKESFERVADTLDYLSSGEIEIPESGPIIGKNGALSPEDSADLRTLNNLFKQVPMRIERMIKAKLPDFGLDPEATLAKIRERIVELNEEAAEARKLRAEEGIATDDKEKAMFATALSYMYESLMQAKRLQNSNTAYFPQMRFGNYGVVVHKKEDLGPNGVPRADADPVFFAAIEEGWGKDTFDKKQFEEIKKQIKELKLDGKQYQVSKEPFRMTYNDMARNLGPSHMSLEAVASLLGSAKQEDYQDALQALKDKVTTKGFTKHLKNRKNIPGYEQKDRLRAANAYLMGSANYITNIKYEDAYTQLETELTNTKHLSSDRRKLFEDYVSYATSPEHDYIKLRSFNFLYTMGGNISTAMLQFVTLFTTTAGLMMQTGSKNFLAHNSSLAKNFTKTTKNFFVKGSKDFDWGNGEIRVSHHFTKKNLNKLVKEGEYTQETADATFKMYRRGKFNPNLTNENIGGGSEVESFRGKARQKFDAVVRGASVFTASAEYLSRITTFISLFESMNTGGQPDKTKIDKAVANLSKDERFQNMRETNDGQLTDQELVASYYLDRAHAVFGKEGRGPLQRGVWGALVFPFMTHPIQMMELFIDGASGVYGRDGQVGALYTLSAYVMLAGMMGIPGYELMEALAEFIYKKGTGETLNIEHEIRSGLSQAGHHTLGEFLTGGVTRAYGDINIAQRINLPVFFQNPVIGVLEGDPSIRDFTGVAGSIVDSAGSALEAVDNRRYGDAVVEMSPTALKNAWKGIVDYNTMGYRSRKGNVLLTAEDITFRDKFLKSVGFEPGAVEKARSREWVGQQSRSSGNQRIDAYRDDLAEILYEITQENKETNPDQEKIQSLQKKYAILMQEHFAFAQQAGKITSLKRYKSSTKRAIEDRLYRMLDPEKRAIEKYKLPELKIYERDYKGEN